MTYSTYEEYLRHPKFRAVTRAVAIRSSGRCEHKGEDCTNVAIDFHHVRYPPWGTFDVPSNLLHVCRTCHEKLHRCKLCSGILKAEAIKADRDICFTCYMETQG